MIHPVSCWALVIECIFDNISYFNKGVMFADGFIQMLIFFFEPGPLGTYVNHRGGIKQQISSYVLQYQHLSVFLCQG